MAKIPPGKTASDGPNPEVPNLAVLGGAHHDKSMGPRRQECGPLGIRIAADGTWFYLDSPIGRKELVKLFATVLSRDEDGVYWMTTPAEHGMVEVEDAPFVAVELQVTGSGPEQSLRVRTNIDDWVVIGPDHPLRVDHNPETGEPAPYVGLWRGMEAKIGRSVFYDLVERAEPAGDENNNKDVIGVWSRGQFFPLGSI